MAHQKLSRVRHRVVSPNPYVRVDEKVVSSALSNTLGMLMNMGSDTLKKEVSKVAKEIAAHTKEAMSQTANRVEIKQILDAAEKAEVVTDQQRVLRETERELRETVGKARRMEQTVTEVFVLYDALAKQRAEIKQQGRAAEVIDKYMLIKAEALDVGLLRIYERDRDLSKTSVLYDTIEDRLETKLKEYKAKIETYAQKVAAEVSHKLERIATVKEKDREIDRKEEEFENLKRVNVQWRRWAADAIGFMANMGFRTTVSKALASDNYGSFEAAVLEATDRDPTALVVRNRAEREERVRQERVLDLIRSGADKDEAVTKFFEELKITD
jgi:hypothetical protein